MYVEDVKLPLSQEGKSDIMRREEMKELMEGIFRQEMSTRDAGQKEYAREVKKHTRNLQYIITFQNLLVDAKMQIVQKLNSVKGLTDTFIKTKNGFKVTNPEGYVAIDRVSGGAVKLVDRMEFSFNNFTAIKAWDK